MDFVPAYLIGQAFVFSDGEPLLAAVGCPRFEDGVQLFDKRFGNPLFGTIDNEVDATEMICRLYDIVYTHTLAFDTDGIRFEDVTRLVMRQAAALDVIGVVGQVDLCAMIDAAFELHLLLFTQCSE